MKRVLVGLLFFAALAASASESGFPATCGPLKQSGPFLFPADVPAEVEDIYRMPQDEALRALFVRETEATKAQLGKFADPAFRRLFADARAENGLSPAIAPATPAAAASAPEANNGASEAIVNGLRYRFGPSASVLPDVAVFAADGKPIAEFAIHSLGIAVGATESLVPLHMSPDHATLVLALDGEMHDRARIFFFRNAAVSFSRQDASVSPSAASTTTTEVREFLVDPAHFAFAWYGTEAGFWSGDSRHYYFAAQGDAQRPGRLVRFDRDASGDIAMREAYRGENDLYLDLQASPNRSGMVFTAYHYGRFFGSRAYDLASNRLVYDTTGLPPTRNRMNVALAATDGFVLIESRDYRRFRIAKLDCAGGHCVRRQLPVDPALNPLLSTVKDYTLAAKAEFGRAFFLAYRNRRAVLADVSLADGRTRLTELPEGSDASFAGSEGTESAPILNLSFNNPLQQRTVVRYEAATGALSVAPPAKDYSAEILRRDVVAKSADGVDVPVTVFYRADSAPSPDSRLLVYLYGEYGTPTFSSWYGIDTIAPIVKRGWVVAFPHIRGSMDFGFDWYLGGTRERKANGLADADASIRALHASGISTADRTAIKGLSAGGEVVSMMLAAHPDRFRIAFFEWATVDALNQIRVSNAPIDSKDRWAIGRGDDPAEIPYVCAESGLHLIKSIPARNRVWVTASFGDRNVTPQPPYGFYRRLKALAPDRVFFYGSASGGHLEHSSPDEMMDFLALELGWAESELR